MAMIEILMTISNIAVVRCTLLLSFCRVTTIRLLGICAPVLQVWFQNARAKHRRTAMKERDKQQQQQPGSDNGGGSAGGGSGGVGVMSGGGSGGMLDVQSMTSGAMRKASLLNELSNSGSPGALSDISSSPSLMGLRASSLDQDLVATSGSHGLADIFSTTLRGH